MKKFQLIIVLFFVVTLSTLTPTTDAGVWSKIEKGVRKFGKQTEENFRNMSAGAAAGGAVGFIVTGGNPAGFQAGAAAGAGLGALK
jgi:hypothetical protein